MTVDRVDALLESPVAERLATGFQFTEGPLWHPDGYYYFADIWPSRLYRLVPGKEPELVREGTNEGNGTTFDLKGRLLQCEGAGRRIVSVLPDGHTEVVVDHFEEKRFNRPNDIICRSDGAIFFSDPMGRVPIGLRELPSAVYMIDPDGALKQVAECEYPNGLAFSPDEQTLYVSNTRSMPHIQAWQLNPDGTLARRRLFADMSTPEPDEANGVPDGMKVDTEGRVFCTGPGGTWVYEPDGALIGVIRTPEVPANLVFGGPDLRTLFLTARTSVYTLRVKTPGVKHPWS
jgi:gluconolactonase